MFTTKIKQKNIREKVAKSILELWARIILVLEVEMLAVLVNMDIQFTNKDHSLD